MESYTRDTDGALMVKTDKGFVNLTAAHALGLLSTKQKKAFPAYLDNKTNRDSRNPTLAATLATILA